MEHSRWLTGEEIEALTPKLVAQGWSPIDPKLSRVLAKFDGNKMTAFIAVRLFPVVGPEWSDGSDPHAAVELAGEMRKALETELGNDNFIVIASSKFSEKFCEKAKLRRVEAPVFLGAA